MQHGAQDFAVERWSDVRIRRIANAEDAADIENLDRVADVQLSGEVPRVTQQRFAMPERADHDVALRNGGHAPGGKFELVVTRLVVQDANGDQYAFFARDLGRNPQLVAQVTVLCDRGDLVDKNGFHDSPPAARVCSEPGSDRMRA